MEFNNSQPIYIQIVDYVCERILLKEWLPEEKIPSVRELAVQLSVNPNTVARSYEFLKNLSIISDRRGVGYFIDGDAVKNAKAYRKKLFTENDLPILFRTMNMLDVDISQLEKLFLKFKNAAHEN